MPLDGVERRLSAILSADVAGYSRLMADDEDGTVRCLTAYREEVTLLVGQHGGRLVDFTGDNFLAEFPSALNATRCAIEIQGVLKARNATLPELRRMAFRMGIHLGDVRAEGERIFGDGVNIAARLEGLAEPGGICVSAAVHEQVRSKLSLGSTDLGEQSVKNMPDPVRVFRVHPARTLETGSVEARERRPSIVVLPFANMSADPEQEYFCDGMAEEVINALTQLEGLHVVARTSAFSFKGRHLDVRRIGEELGVRSVLEGSVRKTGDRLRVTAQLIDVGSGFHLWSERFDRRLDDVFAIQDEISARIVETLKVKLAVGAAPMALKRSDNLAAYHLYLRALYFNSLATEADYKRAIEHFEQALALDPRYSLARAGLSLCYTVQSIYGFLRAREALPKAEAAARLALEHDDSIAQAHVALGRVRGDLYWDWEGARREYLRAIELDPRSSLAHHHYALGYLTSVGQCREALVEIRRALDLDPLSLSINRSLGETLYFNRLYDEAIRQFQQTVEMAPDFQFSRQLLAMAYASNDMPEEALRQRQEILRRAGREKEAHQLEAAYEEAGEPGLLRWYVQRGLRQAERAVSEGGGGNRAFNMSLLYARLGEADEALSWLEKATDERAGLVTRAYVHPWFDPLRPHPRFNALMRMMGLQ